MFGGFQKKQLLSLDVEGDAQIQRELAAFSRLIQDRVSRDALTRGAQFLTAELRTATPRGKTSNLAGSMGYEIIKGFGEWTANVGARKPKGSHAHLVDQGTNQRFRRDGRPTGRNKPQYFMDRTYQARRAATTDIIASELATGIDGAVL